MRKDRTVKTTLVNMCMIYDEKNNKVLVQDKIRKQNGWGGYTFPGGHVEQGESLMHSAIREVKEETGLDVSNLRPCGVIDWDNTEKPERYLVFLYKTSDFTGNLIYESEEGNVSWMNMEDFLRSDLAPNMETYIKLFLNDDIQEAYANWNKTYSGELELI